jgi:NADPH2:quinone reductase
MTQAVVVDHLGGPEVLVPRDQDPGAPGPGQVRVRVEAAGVNFIDVYFRTGVYPRPLPFVAGLEGAGRVESVGEGASFAPGERVAWASVPGSYAEAVVAPETSLVKVPDGVDSEAAAAAMLQGMTAHYLVHGVRRTAPGDVALVHAAAGGTGLLLVQTLKATGAVVIGTCSTDDKAARVRAAGADRVVRYDREDVPRAVRDHTQGRGADVVYDSVGRDTFEGSLQSLKPRGLLALFGQSSGKVPDFDLTRLSAAGSLFVTRPSLAHYTSTREELEERAAAVLGEVARGRLHLRIAERFALADAAEAHRVLEGRRSSGKLLLLP